MSLEHKTFDAELKTFSDSGEVELYAAVFGNVDRVNEVIMPGAFKNLDDFVRDGWLGVNHDMKSMGHATIEGATQDDHGLLLRAKFHSTDDAQQLRTIIKERRERGKSVKASIGYRVTDAGNETRAGKKVKLLKSIDIFEASVVSMPANPLASVVSAKSDDGKIITLDSLRDWLDAETKAGRVLSAANHGKLKDWHDSLSAMCGQIKDMIDQHDPAKAGADGESMADPLAGKSLARLRAASLRARLSLLTPSL